MNAYFMVFDHPFFAVTKPDGSFEITGVPAGKQKLVVREDKGMFITSGGPKLQADAKARQMSKSFQDIDTPERVLIRFLVRKQAMRNTVTDTLTRRYLKVFWGENPRKLKIRTGPQCLIESDSSDSSDCSDESDLSGEMSE